MQRLGGGSAEVGVVECASETNSVSGEASGSDDAGVQQQESKKLRASSPVFDLVAFFDRLSTR